MNRIVYIVFAYRYGDLKGYNYPVGVFSSLAKAKEEAKLHHIYRGGKYDHQIWEVEENKMYDAGEAKVVFSMLKGDSYDD